MFLGKWKMRISQFAIATIAMLLVGNSFVSQQPVLAQSQGDQTQTQQDQRQQDQQRQQAQQRQQEQQQRAETGRQDVRAGESQSKNQDFVRCLAIVNQEQVTIARFAKEKANHDEVKAFAAKLEKDHQDCLSELKGLSSRNGFSVISASATTRADGNLSADERARAEQRSRADQQTRADQQDRTGQQAGADQQERTRQQARADQQERVRQQARADHQERGDQLGRDDQRTRTELTASRDGADTSTVDFLQLHQEMSDQWLENSKEFLNEKKGADFDKCFVGMQVAEHARMHASLTVFHRHASGELQGLIEKSLEKCEQHMNTAVSLLKKLED
jgi:hypothetical protein